MNLEARKAIILRAFDGKAEEGTLANGEPVFFVSCPGEHLHSHDTHLRHTCVHYTGKTITIDCKHESCRSEPLLKDLQHSMRSQAAGMPEEDKNEVMNRPSVKVRAMLDFAANCANKIQKNLPQIFEDYRDESFLDRRLDAIASKERFFALYPEGSVLWIGDVRDSGAYRGSGHFRAREDWIYRTAHGDLYPFTSTSIYVPGSWSRSVASVLEHLYLVLEFDHLSSDPVENRILGWALFRYLAEKYRLKLVLVVDTGNKSLHFWIENEPRFDAAFRELLRRLGADPACLSPSQPVRFPGVMRSDAKVKNQPQCVIAV